MPTLKKGAGDRAAIDGGFAFRRYHAPMLKTRESKDFWLLAIVALLVLGAGLGLRDPWPSDEPRFTLVV